MDEAEAEQDYDAAVMKVGSWVFRECIAGFGSIEDDGTVAAEKHAVLEHQAQSAGEHELLDVAAGLDEILGRVRVIDGNNLLNDNWAPVEFSRDKMGRGTDDLNSALKRLVIRFRAHKGGQKGVMNVDNPVRPACDEFGAENAHIFCQDQKLRPECGEQPEHLGLVRVA